MTRRTLTIGTTLIFALAIAAIMWARADLNINDIKPTAPSVAEHHPRHKPVPKSVPKLAPPVPAALTVSQAAGSKYSSIHSALAAIASGGTITVEPGDYIEDFILTKPVTIAIDSSALSGSVIVESASRPAVSMQTSAAHIKGLRFRTSTIAVARAAVLVDVSAGTLLMEDCNIGPAGSTAVAIRGASARPTLARCVIHDAGRDSVVVSDFAAPTFTDCTISGGVHAAVNLDDNCAPVFSKCTIKGGAWDGSTEQGIAIYTSNGANGSFTDCGIGPAGNSGLLALGASTQFTGCSIHNCGRDGATLEKPSTCSFDHCDVGGCKQAGIAADSCSVTVTATTLHNCGHNALLAMNIGGSIAASDCDFGSNSDHDIAVLNGGAAAITRCNMRRSRSMHSAIFVDGSSAKVYDSNIASSARAAIEANTSTLVVSGGKFHDLRNYGIICDHNALATFTKVEISKTGGQGIWIGNGSDAEITGCAIHNIHGNGIEFHDATGLVTDTKIKRVSNAGIAIWKGHHTITNTVIDGSLIGVALNDHGSADLTRCTISNWTRSAFDKGNGTYTVNNCILERTGPPRSYPSADTAAPPALPVPRR